MPDLEEIRETVKDTVKDAAQQISDATKDAVQQLVQQSLLQLIETAKTLAEQAIVGAKHAEPVVVAQAAADQIAAAAKSVAASAGEPIAAAKSAVAEAAETVAESLGEKPAAKRSGGGFFRFLVFGLIVGAVIAYFTQRGGDDDEDFGEENWIEVKHDESGSGPAHQDQNASASAGKPAEPEAAPSQEELDARATDH